MAITLVHDVDIERRPDPDAYEGDFRDTYIEDAGPNNVHDGTQVTIGYSSKVAVERRGLFYFDLKKYIPASATITAAVWHFYCPVTSVPTDVYKWRLYRLVRTILERIATWNTYGNEEIGVTTGGGANYLDDSSKSWDANEHAGKLLNCEDTGGITRTILSNTATRITINENWSVPPGSGKDYEILGAWTTPGAFHNGDDIDTSVDVFSLTCPNTNDGVGWYDCDSYSDIEDDAWTNRNGSCTFMGYRSNNTTLTGEFQIEAKNRYGTLPERVHHLRITYTLDGKTFQAFVYDGDISEEEAAAIRRRGVVV